MKILFLTMGIKIFPSSRVRVYQYIPHLSKEGFSCRVIPYHSARYHTKDGREGSWEKMGKFLRILAFLFLSPFYDLVFIQKVMLPIRLQKILKLLNPKLIFDFDDAVYLGHQTEDTEDNSSKRNRFVESLKKSEYIVTANEYVRDNYVLEHNRRVTVITSPIDTDRYSPRIEEKSGNEVVVGWIGTPPNTVYLQPVHNVLKTLAQKYDNLRIELVGASDLTLDGVDIKVKEWGLETEVNDLQNFDIGIMPVPDDEWSRVKGGYKLLQYMAVGIPAVASPVGINRQLILEGENGFSAETEAQWIEKLSLLIENPDLRRRMGNMARAGALDKYSFEISTPKLIKVLKSVGTRN